MTQLAHSGGMSAQVFSCICCHCSQHSSPLPLVIQLPEPAGGWSQPSLSGGAWPKMSLSGSASACHASPGRYTVMCLCYRFRHLSHVYVDLAGPPPPSQRFHCLLIMVDSTSRWPEAVPLSSISAVNCTEAFVSMWMARHAVPFAHSRPNAVLSLLLWTPQKHKLERSSSRYIAPASSPSPSSEQS